VARFNRLDDLVGEPYNPPRKLHVRWWIPSVTVVVLGIMFFHATDRFKMKIEAGEAAYTNKPTALDFLESSAFYQALPQDWQSAVYLYVLNNKSNFVNSDDVNISTIKYLIKRGFVQRPIWPGFTTYAAENGAFLLVPEENERANFYQSDAVYDPDYDMGFR